jgi:hypothetical protein
MRNNNLRFAEGEITVYCGDHALANVHASLKQAREIAGSSRQGNIMYVNTVFTTRKMLVAARMELDGVNKGDGRTKVRPTEEELASPSGMRVRPTGDTELGAKEGIFFQHVIIGDLCKYLGDIREAIEANDIKFLIVNSWEFANRSYGYKEKALFGLLNIANEFGVSVLVYSQVNMNNARAGEMHRGGLGKLAAVAGDIIWSNSDEVLEELRETRKKVKILSNRKINELEYARSDSGISAAGELVLPEREEVLEEELMEIV